MTDQQVTIHYNTTSAGNICVVAETGESAVEQLSVVLEHMAAMHEAEKEPDDDAVQAPQNRSQGKRKATDAEKQKSRYLAAEKRRATKEAKKQKEKQDKEREQAEAKEAEDAEPQPTEPANDVPDDDVPDDNEDDTWDDEPEDQQPEQSITLDDIRSLASALGREKGLEMLKKHGAKAPKISALPESAYAAFYEDAKKALGQ